MSPVDSPLIPTSAAAAPTDDLGNRPGAHAEQANRAALAACLEEDDFEAFRARWEHPQLHAVFLKLK